jgi:hypothetical protein
MEIGALVYERKHALRSEIAIKDNMYPDTCPHSLKMLYAEGKTHKKVKTTPGEVWTIRFS